MWIDDIDFRGDKHNEHFGWVGLVIGQWCDFPSITGDRRFDRAVRTIAEREWVGRPIQSVRAGC